MIDDHRDFLVEVSWLHHEYHQTQQEIARRFDVSRSTISRALSDAERLGIVQVVVTAPMRRESRLAADLAAHLGIAAAVGVRVGDESSTTAAARAASRLIERIGDAGHATLAVSWGRTLAATAGLVRPRTTANVRVVDAIGHVGGDLMIPAVDVTRRLAASLGASVVHLPSPAFMAPGPAREVLVASGPVRCALDVARSADVTLVSVGVTGNASLLRSEGLVDGATMGLLMSAGAVGEILGHWYDASGQEVFGAGPAAVGLSLADLRGSRRVVAVAGGAEKSAAILAALAGHIVHELVIDDGLAEALLAGSRHCSSADSPVGWPAATNRGAA